MKKSIVAPFVGAWIETAYGRQLFPEFLVAPFVGAWIETKIGTAILFPA